VVRLRLDIRQGVLVRCVRLGMSRVSVGSLSTKRSSDKRTLIGHVNARPHHDASRPAMGPFWVSRMPISLVPVSILRRVPIW